MQGDVRNIIPPQIEDEISYSCNLIKIIDDIEPKRLGVTSHSKLVKQISANLTDNLKYQGSNILLIIKAIKQCKQPCYKRDLLIEVLNNIFKTDDTLLGNILCDRTRSGNNYPWKELANSIASLPDLVANCRALKQYPDFEPGQFYSVLLEKLHATLRTKIMTKNTTCLAEGQNLFCTQLIGRVALSGTGRLVWERFTSRVIKEDSSDLKRFLVDILTFPLHTGCLLSEQFEIFIEPLYMPIFYYLKPSENCGQLIRSLLGDYILRHESFEYILCDKAILQTNYNLEWHRQHNLLFNIFAYLSSLALNELSGEGSDNPKNLFIMALKKAVRSWSNGTKVLFRSYDHNRFITCALIIAFKYALKYHCDDLLEHVEEIQSMIMQGFSIYLNRSSSELRDLAMCIGELILPKLHETIDERLEQHDKDSQNQKKTKEILQMDFDVKLNDDCLEMKRIFNQEVDDTFKDLQNGSSNLGEESSRQTIEKVPVSQSTSKSPVESIGVSIDDSTTRTTLPSNSSKRAVIELIDSDDDLVPFETGDDVCDSDDDGEVGKDFMNVPIYLRDCINGLSEQDSSPRYYRICLVKAGELIDQLLEQYESRNAKQLVQMSENNAAGRKTRNESFPSMTNDAIRDIATELAQLLLYLDNQYNIDGFDTYRMKALTSLCVAAPDLVVKYLLDEFNGSNKNTRHQLDILQALVASAQQLSGTELVGDPVGDKTASIEQSSQQRQRRNLTRTADNFVKYVSLYFYGIIYQLKAECNQSRVSPLSIVSAVKHTTSGDTIHGNKVDDSYLLSRILFSVSLIIKCVDQQPIMRKLSNDLLDTLAAYRCHPDTGVRKAIVACLSVIKSCTPSVYFEECLYDKTMCLFGEWITAETELIKPLLLRLQTT